MFTPKTRLARRFSHADVTLETKGEDERLKKESDKWSNFQVCCVCCRFFQLREILKEKDFTLCDSRNERLKQFVVNDCTLYCEHGITHKFTTSTRLTTMDYSWSKFIYFLAEDHSGGTNRLWVTL